MPSQLPYQGATPRLPLGGVELPETIKPITGGSSVGTISFKPARYYRKLLHGNLFDSSSSEEEDDPEVASVAAKNIGDDKQHIAQSGDSIDDADSSSYTLEDMRTTSIRKTLKCMEEIVVAGRDEESGA